jgi:hypothetical protein
VKEKILSNRLMSIAMLIGILAIPTLLCGFTVSFTAAFQMWAFLLAFVVPMIGGTLIVYNHFWKNRKLAFVLEALVIGVTFFITSVVGMAIDGRASSWSQIFSFSSIVGMIGFIVVIIFTLFYTFLVRNVFMK